MCCSSITLDRAIDAAHARAGNAVQPLSLTPGQHQMEVGSATHGTRIRDATSTSRHRQTAPGIVVWAPCSFLHCACMLGPHPLHPPSLDVAFGVCGPHVAPRRSETTPARRVTVQSTSAVVSFPPLVSAVPCPWTSLSLGRTVAPLSPSPCRALPWPSSTPLGATALSAPPRPPPSPFRSTCRKSSPPSLSPLSPAGRPPGMR